MPFKKKSLIVAISFLSLFYSCTNDIEEVERVTKFEEKPMQVSTNTEIIYSTKGEIKVRLKAPLMTQYVGDNAYIEMENGIDLTFFDEDMTVKSNLTANYAITKDAEQTYEAKNDVVLINKQGDTLNTEHLVWDSNKELVYSKEFVKITTPKQIIMGHGFESNQDFTKYTMKKITATISVE